MVVILPSALRITAGGDESHEVAFLASDKPPMLRIHDVLGRRGCVARLYLDFSRGARIANIPSG